MSCQQNTTHFYSFLQLIWVIINGTIVCQETIHTGNITAHAFANLGLKSSRIFLPQFMGKIFPRVQLESADVAFSNGGAMEHNAVVLFQQI